MDLSIIQGPFSVAPCHALVSRFATFSSPTSPTSSSPPEKSRCARLAELSRVPSVLSPVGSGMITAANHVSTYGSSATTHKQVNSRTLRVAKQGYLAPQGHSAS
jgi:hypothetical protein